MNFKLNKKIRLAGIEKESIVDGPGIRLVIFTQGCLRNCFNCHNPKTHSLDGGIFYTVRDILNTYQENSLYRGITFSGGEPFIHADVLSIIGYFIHQRGGNVVTYTGYTYEELIELPDENVKELLKVTDILIDGPYIDELKSLELQYRGSSNQRVLKLVKNSYELQEK